MGQIKQLKTFGYWVYKMCCEGKPLDLNALDVAALDGGADEVALTTPSKADMKLFYPPPFDAKKYVAWSRSFASYLDSCIGKSDMPLSYVICPETANPDAATDEYQQVLWSVPHEGFAYKEDNCLVY
jgi:hypothetical protein